MFAFPAQELGRALVRHPSLSVAALGEDKPKFQRIPVTQNGENEKRWQTCRIASELSR
jgi:hypothetical protein